MERPDNCTGTWYPVNIYFPEEGYDVHHDRPCPYHAREEAKRTIDTLSEIEARGALAYLVAYITWGEGPDADAGVKAVERMMGYARAIQSSRQGWS